MEQQERSKMLGSMKMTSLVPKVSVPIMISMLVQALYNVVDSMFVAKYDPDALTAVSLAYPIQVLMIAVVDGSRRRHQQPDFATPGRKARGGCARRGKERLFPSAAAAICCS